MPLYNYYYFQLSISILMKIVVLAKKFFIKEKTLEIHIPFDDAKIVLNNEEVFVK